MSFESLISDCRRIVEDPYETFGKWKEANPGSKVVGTFPVYTPWEIITACNMLPVGIFGGGNQIEIDYADSRIQSFICSISRSTLELGLTGKLNHVDAMIFPSICDVSKNLSGIWKRNFPDEMVQFIHLPQNTTSESAIEYLTHEFRRLAEHLSSMNGANLTDKNLSDGIAVYNSNREKVRRLYEIRRREPWRLTTLELYILMRYGTFVPQADFSKTLDRALESIGERESLERDSVKVVLEGSFCEQPPLEMLHILEEAGCYVVDDDLLVGYRWYENDIPVDGDPYRNLADAYINLSYPSSVKHYGNRPRDVHLLEKIRNSDAKGVLFCAAKFCEPALFDYVLLKDVLEKNNIPYLAFEYEEKMGVFEMIRTQVETFVESILFFS